MRNVIPTEASQEVQALRKSSAQDILAGLKAYFNVYRKSINDASAEKRAQLIELVDLLCDYVKTLDAPYPSNRLSAGFSYACNPKRHTEMGAKAVHHVTVEIIPQVTRLLESSDLTQVAQDLMSITLRYLFALRLVEEDKQLAVNAGSADTFTTMAHDVLRKQVPQMDFRSVANILVTPLIDVFSKKLNSVNHEATCVGRTL